MTCDYVCWFSFPLRGVVKQGKQKLVLTILQDDRMRLIISMPSRVVIFFLVHITNLLLYW